MREIRLFLILSVVLAAGCKPLTASTSLPVNPTSSPGLTSPPPVFQTPSLTSILLSSETSQPVPTTLPTAAEKPDQTSTPIHLQLCSPLQDVSLDELFTIVTTPFIPPPPGQDSGHHGVDFAYYHMGAHTQMLGLPVYSALTGTVAAAILNRPPYGNMVIIETSLDALPANLIQQMAATPVPTPTHPDNRLSCPIHTPHPEWSPSQQSLYLLYAHLNQTPWVKMGQPIPCGGQIGEVGNTGSSGNPHLHFETRLGPSGITFNHMSHYNTQATTEEMDNYCTWRISGVFQLFDPLALLALGKSSK